MLRVYPDTLTVERVLSIEFINVRARTAVHASGWVSAGAARAARRAARAVPAAGGAAAPAGSPLRLARLVLAAWRIRSAPAAGALRTRGRRDAPLAPGRAPQRSRLALRSREVRTRLSKATQHRLYPGLPYVGRSRGRSGPDRSGRFAARVAPGWPWGPTQVSACGLGARALVLSNAERAPARGRRGARCPGGLT